MSARGNPAEVFGAFLALGLTSFGGPVAHLGYFHKEFVEKRRWLSEDEYASLLSLCQFLPGPASSQTGFCLGLKRAGFLGGLAAWLGFTLPSAVVMALLGLCAAQFQANTLARGVLHGLQLGAIAVVAQAVWVMARTLCPDTPRRALALLSTALTGLLTGLGGQLIVLGLGALTGLAALEENALPRQAAAPAPRQGFAVHRLPLICLAIFVVLLAGSLLAPLSSPGAHGLTALAAAFYRTGALVFGGGHVVLPLLNNAVVVPGWVPQPLFLSGYGAAQVMPGPLFTVAAFLGAVAAGWPGAVLATGAIFLPGLLLVSAALPYWQTLRQGSRTAAAVKGVNAAVAGLLGTALLDLATTGTHGIRDFVITILALAMLIPGRARPILVVALCAAAGGLA